MDHFFLIISSYPIRFFFMVFIPFAVGISTAYFGWTSLVERKQAEVEKVIQSRKDKINILIQETENGNKPSYIELINLPHSINELTDSERKMIEEGMIGARKMCEKSLREKAHLRLIKKSTGENMNWSVENLYYYTTRVNVFPNMDEAREAALSEIGVKGYNYLIEELYNIAVNDPNIFMSLMAVNSICKITNYAPYQNNSRYVSPDKIMLSDVPRFEKLSDWWNNYGINNPSFRCPMKDIVSNNRNYYYYDRDNSLDGINTEQRIEFLENILKEYPLLGRSKAELAYLEIVSNKDFNKARLLALDAIKITNTEPLPYLILAEIALRKNDKKDIVNQFINYALNTPDGEQGVLQCMPIDSIFRNLLTYYYEEYIASKEKSS
ncbi:hypothetical protein [Carboxylicivirga sp. RSCT41]|uniref:hypothetical protein n=1 Tax=Carboxylicivirga agarovorans TaxID=3417570 RepID=UPI003D325499